MRKLSHPRRWIAVAMSATLVAGGAATFMSSAHADSSLERALHQRRHLVHQLQQLHAVRHEVRITMNARLRHVRHVMHHGLSPRAMRRGTRWMIDHKHMRATLNDLHAKLRDFLKTVRRKTLAMRDHHRQLTQWVQTYGILRYCPVAGPHVVMNNFGVWVTLPKVPKHIHQGNDIIAPYGTKIVAPFDGIAVASPNKLGGIAVTVYGKDGYAYNAHLSSYGHLGRVKAGTVIGYVGSTGDAGGPHDHFEWHPGNGPAVDPNPFLSAAC